MDTEIKTNSCPKEWESLTKEEDDKIKNDAEGESCPFILKTTVEVQEKAEKDADEVDLEENNLASLSDVGHTHASKKRKKRINRRLIPLRLAIIFWFGAINLPTAFLSVFMKQHGISLVEFSSVFSVTFLCQFFFAYFSGIIADKIGNSKSILIFHMIATELAIICLLLSPSVKDNHCVEKTWIEAIPRVPIYRNLTCCDASVPTKCNFTCCNFTCVKKDASYQYLQQYNDEKLMDIHNLTILLPSSEFLNESSGNMSYFSVSNTSENIYNNCTVSCLINSENVCLISERKFVVIYALLILCFVTCLSTATRFMEIIIMCLVKEHESTYGYEWAFAKASQVVVGIFVAVAMDAVNISADLKSKYDLVFWICAGLMTLSTISAINIKIKISPPGQKLMKRSFKLIKNAEVMTYLSMMLIAGSVFVFFQNFNLWFLDYLSAPKILFGLHNASIGASGIVASLTSKWWLEKLGTTSIFVLGMLSYASIATGYSFLFNPWLSLILEMALGFSYNLFWVAAVQHSYNMAPEGLVATVTAVSGAVHYAIGRSIGVLGGGLLMHTVGPRTTYRILAAECLVAVIAYGVFLYKRQSSKNNAENGETEISLKV